MSSGRQLRPEDTEADGEADAEDDSVDEVTTEHVRPRPQGSSPVYEYCIEDEYFNKKLQQDLENRQRRASSIKMSESQESMEVTLHTEIESGASGFSVAGGGNEGIFVKKVLKESPASKLFSLREGDQLLSATIFFDNIKYEDALKILQYSEPYKVQFSLKRKLSEKEDLETIHSSTLSKKEKLSQGKETLEMSEKTITEEDKANLIVKQRVGRQKRPKKDRLSWPKFQSITGKKILRHRRSRSTSDAYEHAIPDVSPTSTDTEFLPEEIHTKVKKGSQKKLKFPSIGFKMYRSKPETEEKSKLEGKPWTEYEYGASREPSEPMAVEDFSSLAQEDKTRPQYDVKKEIKEPKYELISQTTKCPEVEISIKKPKEKKHKSRGGTKPDSAIITSQITTSASELKDTPTRQTSFPKIRKKKHKGSLEKIQNKMTMEKELQMETKEGTGGIPYQIEQSAEIKDLPYDISISKGTLSLDINAPELEIQTPSAKIHMDDSDSNIEGNQAKFKMPKFQKPKFGISLPKGKATVEGDVTVPCVEAEIPTAELKGEVKVPSMEMGIKASGPQIEAPSVQVEVGEKGKIKMPEVKMPSVKVPKIKGPQVGITLPKVEGDVSLPKVEATLPKGEVSVKVPEAEGTIEGGGMKMHMPKFEMPSMGFSKPDLKDPKVDVDLSAPKVDVTLPSADLSISKPELKTGELAADISVSLPEVKIPTEQASLELKAPDFQIQAPLAEIALEGGEAKLEGVDGRFKMPKFHMPKFGVSLPKGKAVVEGEATVPCVEAEIPTAELKGEVKVPSMEMGIKASGPQIEAPSVQVEVGEKGKIKMPEVKMPSVKVPKIKGPQVGITLPKVEGDVSLPKVEAKLPEGEVSVKVPKAEGSIDGGGMKMHMPKFKMPSMGFSKADVKGPKVDVDLSAPKVDVTLPSAYLSISKPELKTGELAADISVSLPEVKIPTEQASLELKAPDFQIQAPSAEIALEGGEAKLEGVDGRFKMPKFHMPKFSMSLPKGKAIVEGEATVPCVEAEIPTAELKGEVKVPSMEMGIKASGPQIEAPSMQVEVGEKGKIKMPEVKMPSVKVPKIKGPQVGITLPKVEGDMSLPKVEAKLPEGEVSVKVPEAEGSIEGGGMKLHMPKFKMPSMGFSKPDIKGPKVDMDVSAPKIDVTLPSADLSISKPELKTGELAADISVSPPEVKIPTEQASLELKAPDFQIQAPSAEIALEGGEAKLEGVDGRFKMPKFHMPKFGMSLPKGKAVVEGEATVLCVEAEIPTAELKGEVKVPSMEMGIKASGPQIEAPSVQVEVGEKGKIKMPEVKMPSVKVPKIKGPQVGVTLPKVEGDVSLPKVEAKLPEREVSIKVPEAEGSIEGGGMKMHMPKFKMPSMGFSKPDIKGPKVDVDVSAPKVDVPLPSADLSISKPELKTGELVADISVSPPEVKIPTEQASLEHKAPDFQIQVPSAEIALEGGEAKLEGVDGRFKMPKFHMPKFGMSLPKGKAVVEGEATVLCVEAEIPTAELKGEVKVPSMEMGLKASGSQIEAPSVQVEVGEKGKIKMPEVKMPSVKVPKIKGPQVGITLPKVEGDMSLPKVEAKLPEGEVSVKVPEAEGRIEGGGMKMHMPKFKMPSMGFSKPDIKGPKVDMDVSAPKVDVTLPSADLSISKPELKTGELAADISVSPPEVKIPTEQASLELKAPDFQIQAPSAEIALEGGEAKLEGVDGRFKMPKFHMPKFGMSLPKGKAAFEGEATVLCVEAEIPTAELKGEVKVPSMEMGIKASGPQIEAPSVQVEVGEKGKIKMPEVKMPSVKVPKIKGPQVGITLPKVEGDVSLPKVEAKLPEREVSVKVPEAEGSIEGGGMKLHMPKFKMPSMGFSKPDIKGPKVDVDVSAPKIDVTLPSADLSISKPELKTGKLAADISVSAPEVKIPTEQASLELKAPNFQIQAPLTEIALEGGEAKLQGVDGRFKMPKFHMPKFGVSLPKGKAIVEGEATVPCVEAEIPTAELKGEVKVPSMEMGIKASGSQIEAPRVQVEVGEKGKIKMPEVKMPSVKVPKIKGPQVGITLPKIEGDVSLPKVEAKLPEGEVSVKVPEAEGSFEGGGMKLHMPKFKMPTMGFSKPDIKGPKVDMDVSAPKIDVTLPSADLSISKPELKTGELAADISISSPEVKIPTEQASLELKAPDFQIQAPSAEIALEGGEAKLEGMDGRFKMPKFHMPKFGMSLPKGKAVVEGEATVPCVEAEIPTAELKGEVKVPSMEMGIKASGPQIEAPRVQVEVGEKGKIKMPEVKMPSVKVPKIKGPQVGITLPKVEGDVSLPKVQAKLPEGEVSVKVPEAEGSIEGGGMKMHMPKFKMPSMGFSKPDIKGPKVDMDVSAPKVDVTLPSADLSISKPELKTGELAADISVSPPEVKIPTEQASLELKAPNFQIQAPLTEIALEGGEAKLQGVDGRFKMPKFHMPKFGVSLPKGKAIVQGDVTVPYVEAEIPTAELKGEVKVPSMEMGIKASGSQIEAPSVQVEVGEKGKIKMPEVKMPSVKVPKIKGPQVGITLPKVEGDVSLPKVEAKLPEGEVSVKVPEAEGSIEGGGMKLHMPKFKMPSMGFSKPDIKGPKIDMDVSAPKIDVTLPSADLSISKPELKTGELAADISVLAPEVKIPTEQASLELKAPDFQIQAPSAEIALEGGEAKLEGVDGRFKMPKFHMPKFGMSLPKGQAVVEGEATVPCVEAEIPTAELKGEVKVPSMEMGIKASGPQIEAPSMQVEVGEQGKIKMPEVKMPSVKVPKIKGPQVGITLPKVEGDVSLPKVQAKLPEGEVSIKVPEAEGSIEGGGMKLHMPKFKMPSMGFSKPDIKGPKVDVDVSAPKVDVTLPSVDLSISKPELKTGELAADISVSPPEVKIPTEQASLELKAPDFQIQAPSAEIALEGGEAKLEGVDGRFKMPKFHMPKFGMSLPKGKAAFEGEATVPCVEAEIPTAELKGEVKVPSMEMGIKASGPQIEALSVQVEVGGKGKIKMPEVKMPSVKVPKIKGPQVGITLPKVEGDVSLPKVQAKLPEGEVSVKVPEAEGSIEGGGMKMHMPKFKMPSMGFSKPDIKGPKVDMDVSPRKVDVTLPSVDLSISKPELKTGELAADINVSAPEVKIPREQASLELKAPDFQIQVPSAEIALEGSDEKLEGVDGSFKMPKFHMPKFGMSLPKGKAVVEGEATVPCVEAEIPTAEQKGEVKVPSMKMGIKASGPQIEAPSIQVEVGEKGKIKMPEVKMPSVKVPKIKGPQVGVTLPMVEGDVSLPKVEAKLPEREVSVKVPEAEGSIEGGGMKMHMPKFKMPSMGFSKPDLKGPKVDVNLCAPKVDVTLPSADLSISKPELKTGELAANISVSAPEVEIPTEQASLELKAPDFQIQAPSAEIALEGGEAKLEGVDGRFKMPKFHMPKFGMSLPKGKAAVEGEATVPCVEAEIPTAELKGKVKVPSMEMGIKASGPQIEAPSVQVEVGEKGKIKMPEVKMPSVKVPKIKGPQVGITLPKVEGDVSLPKVQAKLPEGEVSVKVPEAEGSIEGGGMKMHMPKFKMPSMGFSKPDIKGPKVDMDVSAPKIDVTLPSADLSISKPELKTGELAADISVSLPEVKIPTEQASLELKAPDFQIQAPSAEIALEGGDAKLEGVDGRFKMPKFHMPKFGMSLPKGKAAVEGEATVPCVEAEIPTAELKGEVKVPSMEMGIKASGPQIEALSVEVEVGEKGKIKMPEVKMPSVKVPKIKGPQVGITLPKVEGDVSLPKVQAKLPEGEVSVKVPEAEGSIEGGGMKMHMPKFKMPSMGFSKPDVKGPKVDMDVSAPKIDVTLPSADLSISKPELKTGELAADISVSLPEVKIPTEQASLELKAPDFQIQAPSAEIALEGGDAKLEGVDGRFKMPKFHMPKFGMSLPKGKAVVEGEATVPCVEAEIPTAELKGEVKVPSMEMGIKASGPQIEALSVEVEVGEKGKIKMPEVKMPSVKVPKIKGPQVGITLPKVEGDVSLPKVQAKLPEGEVSVKVPEAEGSIEGGGMKMHMPKFKMPSMGFSKPDVKGPKVDMDVSAPKIDVTLPSADLSISKPELKTGELAADISVSLPEVKIPTEQASLELKAPDFQIQAPSAEIALEGGEAKLEGVDGSFKMPKFHMPKFGMSLPKGKAAFEGEATVPCVEAEIPTAELKGEVKVPSMEMGIKASGPHIEAPSVQVEVGEKGKIKMPEVKMPSVKVPKIKGPQVGITLPKVEGDVSLPKVEVKLPEGEVSVKVPEAEGSIEGGGMKMHMPKFKMPSMGFSKPDIKGPKVDMDVSAPKIDVTLPSADLSISKPELKTGELAADIRVSAPEVKIPTEQASLELKAPDFQIQAPSAEIALEGGEAKLEGVDGRFKMPKFHMPKFGMSLPKGKAVVEGEATVPCVEAEIPTAELKGEVKVPSMEMGIKASGPQIEAPSVQVEVGEKGKIKMPEVKMPSVKVPKIKGPQVGITLPKVKGDVSLPKVEVKLPEGEVSVKVPEAEGSIEGGGMKMHMPKFKMPSMGFSKPDIKGPKVDMDVSAPKIDVTLPSADLSISKPELKTGELAADIRVSAPEVKIPTEQASLELKAPDFQIQAPSAEIALEGGEAKLEGVDGRFKMPKFHMPKFGMSLPKGKAVVEGEATVPSVEAEIPTAELKGEVKVPSMEMGIKASGPQIEAPSMQVEVGEQGKIKMPEVKMPSVKVPKIKGPQVGITLPKVEGDVSLPKVQAKLPKGEVSVKVPEAEGSIEGGGMKLHMPKFKMPSMGFSKPDIKGPKVDVDVSAPKIDVTLPSADLSISKPELKTGELAADISVSVPKVKIPTEQASLELKASDFQIQAPSAEIALEGSEAKLEGVDGRFKMPKFHMPKLGISLPKGKTAVEGEVTVPCVEAEIPTAELKGEVKVPSMEMGIKASGPQIEAPSMQVEVGEKGKIKMPEVKMPSVKVPKIKGPQVGVTLPKVEGDVSLPKVEAKLPEGEVSVKVPEAEGSIEGGGMKLHMPKFKMPSMGFSKPDVKGPKVDMDVSAPKIDVTLPSADLSISKPELKTGELAADISVSLPEVKIPTEQASLELKAPDFQIQAPSAEIALEGGDAKLEGVDGRFKMPKFHMPKFGMSLPKGKAVVEGEATVPCVEAEIPTAELKGEVKVPSMEMGIQASGPQIEAPSVQVEVGEKGKIKMPEVKMPSVKVPKIKGPQVGIIHPKVEGDVSLPKVEAKLPEGEVSVKVPEAEGSIEGGGMKMRMPKFKMPSMGFSKPDIKGPKVDVDVSAPKIDVTLPSADLSISKPELKTGELAADISVSSPEVKIPTEQASLELKAPDFQIQAPSAEIALEGGEAKLEGVDGRFKMPKFHMPKFGMSLPKGKAVVEGEVTVPCVEAEIPTAELKGEVKVPSMEMGIKASGPQIEAPSVQVEVGEKGKIKMPEVKMPSVKVPKIKGPQVGVTLPKVEGDVSLPKVEAKLPEGEVSVKVPEAEGSIEGGGMKLHMPKFKMPSMGFSKPDIKGPKVDVDVSAPKIDVTLPSADLSISKPELKTGELAANIRVSAPEVKIPTEQASLDLKAPDFQIQAPSAEIALEGGEAKLEGVDGRFKMPKFHMPKFGMSLPKGIAMVEGEVTVPCVEAEIPTAELKGEVKVPSMETQMKMPEAQIEFSSVQVKVGENVPEISAEAFSCDSDFNVSEIAVDGSKGKMKMPKFHIPKFGLSRTKEKTAESKVIVPKAYPDIPGLDTDVQILDIRIIEGHEIEADDSEPQIHTSPGIVQQKNDAHISSIDVPLPSVDISVPKADVNIQAPCLDIKGLNMDASEKDTTEKESKFKMPKFKLPSFNWSPKKEASISGQADANLEGPALTISTSEREPELTLTVEVDEGVVELDSHVSVDKDTERSKFRRPQFSMPKLSLPKMKGHKADMSVSQLESDLKVSEQEDQGDRTLPIPEQEISGEGAKKVIKLPKVKLPSLELSKPEIKAPHVDMGASLSESDVQLHTSDVSLSKPALKLGDISVDVSTAASEIKGPMAEDLVGPEIKMEGQSTEISLDGAEIKMEGVEGKIKKPKFQMPRFGISFSKGKVPDTEVSLPSIEGEVPQLKTTTDIADIAVEAPTLEAEYAVAGGEKIKIPLVSKAVTKTPALNVQLPSVGLPMLPPEKDFQSVEFVSKEEKPEGDLKTEILDTEEKDGHFKMPKFKLPSFGWSPKKEASLKTDIKEPLEDPKIMLPEDTDSELTVVASEDQGVQMDLDAEMSSKKGQVKRPHFAMPKISLPKPKLPKSQASLSKVDIATEEREGVLVQIPDIESSFTTGDEEATEISIKMPKGISKPEIKAPKTAMEAKVLTADVEVPVTGRSFELKSSGREFEGKSDEIDVDTAGRKSDGLEIRLPKLQMPKFGTSVSEGEVPQGEVVTPAMKAEASKRRVTTERLDGEAPVLDVQVDTADVEVKGSSVKTKVSQMPAVEIKASDTSVCGPDEKDIDVQEEHEIQTEGSQGWFKMPKFRMPSFGRSPSKGKKSDAEDESDIGKAPAADTQVERKAVETAVQALHVDTESCSGKDSLEGKVTCPPVPIPEGGVFIQKEKDSAVGPSVGQGSPLKPSGKIDMKLSAEGGKTYADVVKFGADEQEQKPPFSSPRDELCGSEISVPKVDATFPKSGPALQLKTKPDDAPSVGCSVETKSLDVGTDAAASAEITVDGTERRIDIAGPKEAVTMLSRGAVAKAEASSETKSPKKDSQGKESGFKMPKFSMPSFGWSTPKSSGNVAEDLPHPEEPKAVPVEIKTDASITDEDFEIIEFPVEDFEKDMPTEVEAKAEEKDRSSKTKASKFKMPKFGSLRTKSRGSEVDPPKGQAEGSLAKTEEGTLEIQIQKGDEPVDLKGTKISSVDKEIEDSELSFHIPKLKMPKFVHSPPTAEGQVLSLEGTTDGKVVDADGVSQPELRTKVLEEKADQTGYDIQKSKVRITTLSEPAVQRTKMESKMPSKESVFAETAVRIQRPMEFSTSFPKEQIDTMGSTVHKSVAKIAVLTEPDIQTTQFGIKLPSADPFTADASVRVQETRGESREIKIETTSVYSYDSKSQETFSTQIVRESEIPPSEIKTATYGFSLLKLKMQEPHLNIGVPVKCSSTEDMSETFENKDCQPEVSVESSGIATQKTVSIEFKVSDKGQVIAGDFPEGASSTTMLTKLKPFAVDVQSSSEFADSCSDMQPKEISVSAVSKDNEEMKTSKLDEELAEQKEDSDNSSSSGRFKFWFPTIGFSSSVDDTTSDSKAEDQTLFPEEMQPKDPTATDSDPSKQAGWFRFPKLGFSSPAKKSRQKRRGGSKEDKNSG